MFILSTFSYCCLTSSAVSKPEQKVDMSVVAYADPSKVRRLTECPKWLDQTRKDLIDSATRGKYSFDLDIFTQIVFVIEAAFNRVHPDLKNNKDKQAIVNHVIAQCYSVVCGQEKQRVIKENSKEVPLESLLTLDIISLGFARQALRKMPNDVICGLVEAKDNTFSFCAPGWNNYMSSFDEDVMAAQQSAMSDKALQEKRRDDALASGVKKVIEKRQEAAQSAPEKSLNVKNEGFEGQQKAQVFVVAQAISNLEKEKEDLNVFESLPEKFTLEAVEQEPDWVKANRSYAELLGVNSSNKTKHKPNKFVAGISKAQQLKSQAEKESGEALRAREKEELEKARIEAEAIKEDIRLQKLFLSQEEFNRSVGEKEEQEQFDKMHGEKEGLEKKAMRFNARLAIPEMEKNSETTRFQLLGKSAWKSLIGFAVFKKQQRLETTLLMDKEAFDLEFERLKLAQEAEPVALVVGDEKYVARSNLFQYKEMIDPSRYRRNPYSLRNVTKEDKILLKRRSLFNLDDCLRIQFLLDNKIALDSKPSAVELYVAKKNQAATQFTLPDRVFPEDLSDAGQRPRLMTRGGRR